MADDHSSLELTVYRMVLGRLPFLEDTVPNKEQIGRLTLEVMWELEPCFRIAKQVDPPDEGRVGNEEYYTVPQLQVVADVVTAYIVLKQMALLGIGGSGTGGAAAATFISKAKAGSVEVEYEQFKTKDTSWYSSAGDLYTSFKQSAINRAAKLGCVLDICDDCTATAQLMQTTGIPAFIVTGGGCGCGC